MNVLQEKGKGKKTYINDWTYTRRDLSSVHFFALIRRASNHISLARGSIDRSGLRRRRRFSHGAYLWAVRRLHTG